MITEPQIDGVLDILEAPGRITSEADKLAAHRDPITGHAATLHELRVERQLSSSIQARLRSRSKTLDELEKAFSALRWKIVEQDRELAHYKMIAAADRSLTSYQRERITEIEGDAAGEIAALRSKIHQLEGKHPNQLADLLTQAQADLATSRAKNAELEAQIADDDPATIAGIVVSPQDSQLREVAEHVAAIDRELERYAAYGVDTADERLGRIAELVNAHASLASQLLQARIDLESLRELTKERDDLILAEYKTHKERYTKADGSNMSEVEILRAILGAAETSRALQLDAERDLRALRDRRETERDGQLVLAVAIAIAEASDDGAFDTDRKDEDETDRDHYKILATAAIAAIERRSRSDPALGSDRARQDLIDVLIVHNRNLLHALKNRPSPRITYRVFAPFDGVAFTGLASIEEATAKASERYDRPAHRDDFLEENMPPERIIFWHGERDGVDSLLFGFKPENVLGWIEEEHHCAFCNSIVGVKQISAPVSCEKRGES